MIGSLALRRARAIQLGQAVVAMVAAWLISLVLQLS
jgi:hypothetical protein